MLCCYVYYLSNFVGWPALAIVVLSGTVRGMPLCVSGV